MLHDAGPQPTFDVPDLLPDTLTAQLWHGEWMAIRGSRDVKSSYCCLAHIQNPPICCFHSDYGSLFGPDVHTSW